MLSSFFFTTQNTQKTDQKLTCTIAHTHTHTHTHLLTCAYTRPGTPDSEGSEERRRRGEEAESSAGEIYSSFIIPEFNIVIGASSDKRNIDTIVFDMHIMIGVGCVPLSSVPFSVMTDGEVMICRNYNLVPRFS